jgi:hypothetical protein
MEGNTFSKLQKAVGQIIFIHAIFNGCVPRSDSITLNYKVITEERIGLDVKGSGHDQFVA